MHGDRGTDREKTEGRKREKETGQSRGGTDRGIAEGRWDEGRRGKEGARLSEWATRGSISWERLLGRISPPLAPLGVAWGRLAFAFVAKLHSSSDFSQSKDNVHFGRVIAIAKTQPPGRSLHPLLSLVCIISIFPAFLQLFQA
jgi:hypothetical protein